MIPTATPDSISRLAAHVTAAIRGLGGRVVVAFSGGVDSSVVAKLATREAIFSRSHCKGLTIAARRSSLIGI